MIEYFPNNLSWLPFIKNRLIPSEENQFCLLNPPHNFIAQKGHLCPKILEQPRTNGRQRDKDIERIS